MSASTRSTLSGTGKRSAGVLLNVTSLPTPFGIGDLGPAAFEWINLLSAAKQRWWQILPLGPAGAGDSPYQCYSAFAGSPLVISPEQLVEDGLLYNADVVAARMPAGPVRYARVARAKHRLLTIAFERFTAQRMKALRDAFELFQSSERNWLDDYALFAALQETYGHADWTRWPQAIASRNKKALATARTDLRAVIRRHAFWQFLFARQLNNVREHARANGVGIIGDLPIFVSFHSADVWANPTLFDLDRSRQPRAVAGVPPDLFSATGQRWGNPLYNWGPMRGDNFAWWRRRFRATLTQCDIVRLDHFRGFESYWRIPAECPTAIDGRWVRGPGGALLEALRDEIGCLPVIAEDLGVITPAVERLRDDFNLPGMRILQFAFGGDGANPHLPHNYVRNCVAYTGTHDNDTTLGWHQSSGPGVRDHADRYAGIGTNPARAFVRLAWTSTAATAIVPAQDILSLGRAGRMNMPGTANGNWQWRLNDFKSLRAALKDLAELTVASGR